MAAAVAQDIEQPSGDQTMQPRAAEEEARVQEVETEGPTAMETQRLVTESRHVPS